MTTWIALALWIVIAGVILSGAITVRDIDWFGRMGPAQGVPACQREDEVGEGCGAQHRDDQIHQRHR